MQFSTYNSPLGSFYLYFYSDKLVYASFNLDHGKHFVTRHFGHTKLQQAPLEPEQIKIFDDYFSGAPLDWIWPLELYGTPFQKQVWEQIQKIPQGQVSTYKNIGTAINSKAYQAIGQAVGANPISIIIPCHRVLGTNWFGGYGGGLNRKRLLLELENVTLAPNLNA